MQNSTRAPCWLQKQIAAQNSYVDTIREKSERVYKPPCEFDKPKIAEATQSSVR